MKEINEILSNENPRFTVKINPENPTVKFSVKRSGYSIIKDGEINSALIEISVIRKRNPIELKYFTISNDPSTNTKISEELFPQILNDPSVKEIIVELKTSTFKTFDIDLSIQIGNDFLDVKNPLEEFRNHIINEGNTKILFSAPFGSGKTTFLNYFFKENNTRFEVFKVFPVNYSVATNEDIFKYIKTDILFQLLGKDVEFEKSESTLISSFEEYIYLNPKKAIISFLKNISHLNVNTKAIAKVIKSLNEFMKPIFDHHKIDEKELTIDYLKEIYEREGSLFEDNFYTQLIRQLVEQLKVKKNKDTVLVIEDLDRMDPEHIFRILNVISAHYDTYKYLGDEEHHNKFGFDKVIVVCDIENIRNIFHHKYGEKTHFWGYMNKYFSSAPFHYNSIEMKNYYIEKNFTYKTVQGQKYKEIEDTNKFILKLLAFNELLSLRELEKLKHEDLRSLFTFNTKSKVFYSTLTAPIIIFLCENLGKTELIKKLKLCIEKKAEIIGNKQLYHYYSLSFIAGINDILGHNVFYKLNDVNCSFKINFSNQNTEFYTAVLNEGTPGSIATLEDFYNLFILNVEKYDTLLLKELNESLN